MARSATPASTTARASRAASPWRAAPRSVPAVAELALALTLAATRLVAEGDAEFRRGAERWLNDGNQGARSLHGSTVGFVGAGNLARHLQRLLAPVGVTILGYDPWITDGDPRGSTPRPS